MYAFFLTCLKMHTLLLGLLHLIVGTYLLARQSVHYHSENWGDGKTSNFGFLDFRYLPLKCITCIDFQTAKSLVICLSSETSLIKITFFINMFVPLNISPKIFHQLFFFLAMNHSGMGQTHFFACNIPPQNPSTITRREKEMSKSLLSHVLFN